MHCFDVDTFGKVKNPLKTSIFQRQGPEAKPTINRCIIVCPSSLVKNWDKEISKWLHGRVNSLPIDSGKRDEIIASLKQFMSQIGARVGTPVIIISYETFRLYADILHEREIGLVICDEVCDYFC